MSVKVGEKNFKKIAWIVLSALLIVTVGLSAYIPSLQFDYNFEKFFPVYDEESSYFF